MPSVLSMPSVLTAALLGRRVVVRSAAGPGRNGPYRDTLGDLIHLDETTAVLDTRAGRTELRRSEIALVRLVEPSAAHQLALEATAARGWRARTVQTSSDGWLLRADSGWTGRANSALALRTLRRPLAAALTEVGDFYREHGLPVQISVPLPAGAGLDAALAAAGWSVVDVSDVMTGRLDLMTAVAGMASPAISVEMSASPSTQWLSTARYRGGPLPDGAPALLERHDHALFASALTDGRAVGVARGALDDGWLGITLLDVEQAYRRRGVASALLRRLAAEARQRGATRMYVQVSTDNAAAIAVYRALGLHRHHSYVYRSPPPTHRHRPG